MLLSPERIREARLAAGYTPKQLAEIVGVADRTIRRCEQGLFSPRSTMLGRLACALGVQVGDFYVHAEDGGGSCGCGHPPDGGEGPAQERDA